MGTPYKRCPRCHAPAHLETETCYQCGHHYRTQFVTSPDRTQAYGLEDRLGDTASVGSDALSRPLLVALMWLCVLLFATFWKFSIEVAAACNLGAIVLALLLASSRSRADRISGSVMLVLQCILVAVYCWFQFKGR
jgi:hypothetical protein